MTQALMPTYARLPVTFTKGEGAILWDTHGKAYLDAISGIAVCGLGHARREIAEAIADQATKLIHTSNLYHIELQEQLAEKLCALSGMQRVFAANSGAEANEAAIKIARLYGYNKGIDVPTIVVMDNAFHGRTMATVTATGNVNAQTGFGPLLEGFVRVPYGDTEAVKAVMQQHSNVVAVMVEPVQGEGGIRIPPAEYLPALRQLCDAHDCLLILDEIQTGMCRTGRWFAFQHAKIQPDVMTLAKALGNGMPIGACLVAGKASDVLGAGNHGSTFGGNPLACRAALSTIDVMQQENLAARAAEMGQYFQQGFERTLSGVTGIKEIRTFGLMIGIELEKGGAGLVQAALQEGLLINVTAGNVVRLLPPLVISEQQADEIITKTSQLIQTFLQSGT